MTLDEMKKRRAELGMTYEELSRKSGVPLPTVQKIFCGKTKSPRYTTLVALERALSVPITQERGRGAGSAVREAVPNRHDSRDYTAVNFRLPMLQESAPAYGGKHQGEYTVDDWYNLPEDCHMELIDGVLYDLSEPTTIHQMIAGQLYAMFLACITEHGMDCVPFIAPCGVQLDYDNKTMVEPDVFIICDRSRILRSHVPGAPDLAVEVLSPNTRKKDMTVKCEKYRKAGVKEYWIVDPDKRKVIVYTFDPDGGPDINLYGFDSEIPIGISDGKCSIDFHKVYEYVKFVYDQPE